MKLTKQTRVDLAKAYQCALDVCILDMKAPLRYFNQYIAEDISGFGTAADEKVTSREDCRKMVMDSRKQSKGMIFKSRKITPYRPKFIDETTAQFRDEIIVQIGDKKNMHSLHLWFTTLFKYRNNKWQMVLFHGSMPDAGSSSADTFHVAEAEKKLKELEQVVAQRTADLQAKTRELEIEASLERVRAVTMGMNKPGDILDICKVFFTELQSLGFTDLRNTLINFWDDENGQLHDYDYSDFSGGNFAKLAYSSHPTFEQFQKKIRKAKDAFAKLVINKDGLKSWQQRRRSSGEYKDPRLNKISALYYYFYSTGVGALGISTFSPISKEEVDVLKKFRNVFDMAYQRYIDIQKAEVQAREAQIEAALERVRARTMAMQNSNELPEAANVLFQQAQSLGMPAWSAGYCTWNDDEKKSLTLWMSSEGVLQPPFVAPTTKDELFIQMRKGAEEGKSLHVVEMGGRTLVKHYQYMRTLPVVGEILDSIMEAGHPLPNFQIMHQAYFSKGFLLFITYEPVPEMHDTFKRFANVFDQIYTRFLDLQKAEAQAREAQVEAALERIRAASLAMKDSSALSEIIFKLYGELTKLDAKLDRCFIMIVNPENKGITWWMAGQEGLLAQNGFFVPMNQHPSHLMYLDYCKKRKKKWTYLFEGKEKRDWDRFGFTKTELAKLPEPIKAFMAAAKKVHLSGSSDQFGSLVTGSFEPLPEEQQEIICRFAIAFNQAYVRFLDLQKAEAQAREAEIQLALERVRARSLAMHKTDELQQVVNMVAQQLLQMGIDMDGGVFIAINDEVNNDLPIWAAAGAADYVQKVTIPFLDKQTFTRLHDAIIRRQPFYTEVYSKKDKNEFLNHLFRYHPWNQNSEQRKKELLAREGGYARSVVINQHTSIGITNHHGKKFTDAENEILRRFGSVLEQSYTRFLDLQKAEAQAREAQIEAALERVRSRSLAMHSSDELGDVVTVVLNNLMELGYIIDQGSAAHLVIFSEGTKDFVQWSADPALPHPVRLFIPYTDLPILTEFWDARQKGHDFFARVYSFDEKNTWFNFAFEHSDLKHIPGELKELLLESETYAHSIAIEKNSAIIINSITSNQLSENQIDILRRFSKVFEQAYVRFLDLQRAEAQAREAQIEAALERVRSRSMAMHKSEELSDLSLELVKQVQALGVATWFCAFNIYDDDPQGSLEWGSNGQGVFPRYRTPREGVFLRYYEAGQRGEKLLINEIGKDECPAHYEYLCSLPGVGDQLLKMKEAGIPFPSYQIDHVAFFKYGYIIFITYEPVPETHDIFKRFAKVFEQTYTRFLDLQKAEAQAREAQIEAALERVRSRSIAMRKSEEIADITGKIFSELRQLDLVLNRVLIWTFNDAEKYITWWSANPEVESTAESYRIDYNDQPVFINFLKAWQERKPVYLQTLSGDAKRTWEKHLFENTEMSKLPEVVRKSMREEGTIFTSSVISDYGLMMVGSYEPLSDDNLDITQRFGRVFQQSYTRYLDVQKAEAQAREAQIEAALERIRGKVTTMQESSELLDIVVSMRNEFVALSHEAGYFWYMRWLPDKYEKAMTSGDGSRIGMVMTLPRHIHGDIKLVADWEKSDEPALVFPMDVDTAVEYVDKMITLGDFQQVDHNAPTLDDIRHIGGLTFVMARTTHGEIGYSLTGVVPNPPEEDVNTLVRFAAVFDLAYRRFEDLKEAERRNRETQVELALERVRSRSMAMHKSEELKEVIKVVLEQFVHLNINVEHAGFYIDYKAHDDMHIWLADPNIEPFYATFPYFDTPTWNSFRDAKAKGKSFFTDLLNFEEKNKFYKSLFHFFEVPEDARKFYMECKGLAVSTVLLDNVGLYIENFDAVPYSDEENNILIRFGKVFQQTYTRFLDLQKAEAQTKEAQIEASLERVRSRTMAMQKSDELLEAGELLCSEMNRLGITSLTSGYVLMDADERIGWNYTPNPGTGKIMQAAVGISHAETAEMQRVLKCWKDKEPFSIIEMDEVQTIMHQTFIAERSINFPLSVKELLAISPKKLVLHNFNFKEGYILIVGGEKLTNDQIEIMLRFANVFQQTYTRFLDLQKAEAQAREAQIEAALEKVRSRTLAMQKSDELAGTAAVLFQQLISLGIEPNRLYIILIKENTADMEAWVTDEDGSKVSMGFTGNYRKNETLLKMYEGWRANKGSLVIDMRGEELQQYFHYLHDKLNVPFKGGLEQKRRVQHIAYFSHGLIGMASPEEQPAATMQLLERFAAVFNLTFTRFNDLQIAEAHARQAEKDLIAIKEAKQKAEEALSELQATQKQLVQSEKMASLGELTAGIAHEIQNPLNFVNNFSEVSKELLDEMKEELEKGNVDDAREIMNDVIQNLEKINHHGKRADGIVKGMLQHSRSSSGQKELTDINALCDEYLRLAYHGLRAKDKSFNAKFETDLDTSIGKINILPQDVGRVVLNLINNAFYAVSERKKAGEPDYEPTVAVSTLKKGNTVEISVTDNGTGIPQKVIDKIFQPFFTTKPTGQGTGLGLSLSYDIVTKGHDGELKVETKEGEGTIFKIIVPA